MGIHELGLRGNPLQGRERSLLRGSRGGHCRSGAPPRTTCPCGPGPWAAGSGSRSHGRALPRGGALGSPHRQGRAHGNINGGRCPAPSPNHCSYGAEQRWVGFGWVVAGAPPGAAPGCPHHPPPSSSPPSSCLRSEKAWSAVSYKIQ